MAAASVDVDERELKLTSVVAELEVDAAVVSEVVEDVVEALDASVELVRTAPVVTEVAAVTEVLVISVVVAEDTTELVAVVVVVVVVVVTVVDVVRVALDVAFETFVAVQ